MGGFFGFFWGFFLLAFESFERKKKDFPRERERGVGGVSREEKKVDPRKGPFWKTQRKERGAASPKGAGGQCGF